MRKGIQPGLMSIPPNWLHRIPPHRHAPHQLHRPRIQHPRRSPINVPKNVLFPSATGTRTAPSQRGEGNVRLAAIVPTNGQLRPYHLKICGSHTRVRHPVPTTDSPQSLRPRRRPTRRNSPPFRCNQAPRRPWLTKPPSRHCTGSTRTQSTRQPLQFWIQQCSRSFVTPKLHIDVTSATAK